MDAYGIKSFTDFYNPPKPHDKVPYYPIWTITVPTGSPAHIEGTRHGDLMKEYVPRLVMSSPDEFEIIWEDYVNRTRPLLKLRLEYLQEQVNWRVENWGPKLKINV